MGTRVSLDLTPPDLADATHAQVVVPCPADGPRQKLLDRVRHAIRTRHYSRRTEQAALLDTRRGPRVSVLISEPAGDCRDRLGAYPRRLAAGLLLESPWISGDCERDDRIRTTWATRGFAAHY